MNNSINDAHTRNSPRSRCKYTRYNKIPDDLREQAVALYNKLGTYRAASEAMNKRHPDLHLSPVLVKSLVLYDRQLSEQASPAAQQASPAPTGTLDLRAVAAINDARDLFDMRQQFKDTYGIDYEEVLSATNKR